MAALPTMPHTHPQAGAWTDLRGGMRYVRKLQFYHTAVKFNSWARRRKANRPLCSSFHWGSSTPRHTPTPKLGPRILQPAVSTHGPPRSKTSRTSSCLSALSSVLTPPLPRALAFYKEPTVPPWTWPNPLFQELAGLAISPQQEATRHFHLTLTWIPSHHIFRQTSSCCLELPPSSPLPPCHQQKRVVKSWPPPAPTASSFCTDPTAL